MYIVSDYITNNDPADNAAIAHCVMDFFCCILLCLILIVLIDWQLARNKSGKVKVEFSWVPCTEAESCWTTVSESPSTLLALQ